MKCRNCGKEIPDDSAFCPECGKPVKEEQKAATCPQCGAPLKPGAAFCSNCGKRVADASAAAASEQASEPQGQQVPPQKQVPQEQVTQKQEPQEPAPQKQVTQKQAPQAEKTAVIASPKPVRETTQGGKGQAGDAAPKKHRSHKGVVIAVVVALVACCAGAGIWYKMDQDRLYRERTAEVSVPIEIDAPNYTSDATRIPIRIQGTTSTGEDIDKTVYIGMDDSSIDIAPGSYELTVVASPILEDGSLYEVPADSVSLEVPEGTQNTSGSGSSGNADSSTEQEQSPTIALTPISDQSSVTDEQIEAAKEAAAADPEDGGKAETLAQAATSLRDEEVKKNAVGNLPSNLATGGYAVSDGTYDYFAVLGKGICRAGIKTGAVDTLASLGEDDHAGSFNLDGDKLFYVQNSAKVCCLDISTGTISVIDAPATGLAGSAMTKMVGLYEYGQELYEVIETSTSTSRAYQVYSLGEDGSSRTMVASYQNAETVEYPSPAPFVTRDGIVYALNASQSASSIYSQPFGGTAAKICDVSNGYIARTPIVQDSKVYYSVQSGTSTGELHSIGLDGTGDAKLVEESGTYDGVDLLSVADGAFYIQGGNVMSGLKILRVESGSSSPQTIPLPSGYIIPYVQDAGDHLILLDSDTDGRMTSAAASDYEGGSQVIYSGK